MRSIGFIRVAVALVVGGFGSVAQPCSIMRPSDVPFSFEHYAFYGEVVGYSSLKMTRCGFETERAECPRTSGLRIRILEPIHVPARAVTEFEYYDFGIDSMCSFTPEAEEFLREEFPVGARVAVAASLYKEGEPGSRKIRLTMLNPPIGKAMAVLPKDADLRKLAAEPFDYAQFADESAGPSRPRITFELWRDKLRLQKSRNEREALPILLRMAPTGDLGEFETDDQYSAIEQLVDRYLPTPAVREEFARKLREQVSSAAH
jgi:hypothetical protein